MRVTNNMLTMNLLKNLSQANRRMDIIQRQLSTGQKLTKPSDDPAGIEMSLRIKESIKSMEQWKDNAAEALSYMETTESTLANMTSMLHRVRELAVKGSDGSNSLNDRSQIAKEIDQLTHQFQVMANSQIGSKYIFSGTHIDIPPMEDLPDLSPPPALNQWNGNFKAMQIEVGPNVKVQVSVKGTDLFGITDNGDGTQSSSFFETMNKLSTALYNGDEAAINESIDEVDGHMDNFLTLRAELGARTNRMNTISHQLENSLVNLKTNLSQVQDVDMAEAIMDFQSTQNVFRAALAVGTQIIQPSLVDFMR